MAVAGEITIKYAMVHWYRVDTKAFIWVGGDKSREH